MRAKLYPQLSYLLLVGIASTGFVRLAVLFPACRTAVIVLFAAALILCFSALLVDELIAAKVKVMVPIVWVLAIATVVVIAFGGVVGVL